MRIAISGGANTGKSTLVEAFKQRWPMYSYPINTYRDILKSDNLPHSSNTTEETQLKILDWMLHEIDNFPKGSKVIYDRCTWDCLAYTLNANTSDKISDAVTAAVISIVRESMKNLDIIFWIERDKTIKMVDDGVRDVSDEFNKSIDVIFADLMNQYQDNLESDIFYPKEDCPAIIKVEGKTTDDRLYFISEFLDQNGNLIETESSVLDPNNLELMEQMIKEQLGQKEYEEKLKKITESFGNKL